VKAVKLRYCLVSRFGLVTAFTIRSLYNSDNVVSIELEISGNFFLPCGHYTYIVLLACEIKSVAKVFHV